jgi:hypothetical protein
MMSHQSYIDRCDEEDLSNLIRLAIRKLDERKNSTKVKLWVVSDEWLNLGWFKLEDHDRALEFYAKASKERVAKGDFGKVSLSVEKYPEEEVAELLTR